MPRDGTLVRVTPCDADELRIVRTELELLRRIGRKATRSQRAPQQPGAMSFADVERDDLRRIIADADHPALEEMIALFDKEFPETKKEIIMSAVNEESENIVQDAVESGAMKDAAAPEASAEPDTTAAIAIDAPIEDATNSATPSAKKQQVETTQPDPVEPPADASPDLDMPPDLDEALAAAEAALADVVGMVSEDAASSDQPVADCDAGAASSDIESKQTNQGEPTTKEPGNADNSDTPVKTESCADEGAAPEVDAAPPACNGDVAGATEPDTTEDANPLQSAAEVPSDTTDETAPGPSSDPAPETNTAQVSDPAASEQPADAAAPVESSAAEKTTGATTTVGAIDEPPASTTPDSDTLAYTAEDAQRAVAVIEKGIRSLAEILRTEVKDKWTSASDALNKVTASQDKVAESQRSAESVLEAIARLKEEAQVARDEADAARREAKLFREDARRAKRRAESSADAAEIAADQAAKETLSLNPTPIDATIT